ncbi:MAG: ATP-binding protein [Euryarchaeota archaeon]|nr:ATP-binding protein [Euryarchaeota archaeon]MDE2045516.1 ATP-binding protein [Thermoplasmata archaeon]
MPGSEAEQGQPFDLNIEEILENWEVHHALREIIANALDEQLLSKTEEVQVRNLAPGRWVIRDFGRGLRYEHLTQKENSEKLTNPACIGHFGIGLKDALATLHRRGVSTRMQSRHGDITTGISAKAGFDDVRTLHAFVARAPDPGLRGTEFLLEGVPEGEMEKAKGLFLRFSGDHVIEETSYGSVVQRANGPARIYIKGVRVALEENFLFGYNITSLTKQLTKALNRERSNVGRGAYTDRVKAILLASRSVKVAQSMMVDLQEYSSGRIHDELGWVDVQEHAVKTLNANSRSVFLTAKEMQDAPMLVDEAKHGGFTIVQVPDVLKARIAGQLDISGNVIRDLGQFETEYNESFEYNFVKVGELTARERQVYDTLPRILSLAGGRPSMVREIRISETMRVSSTTFGDAEGCWGNGMIVVKRSALRSVPFFAGTLLHELVHARTGAPDCDRGFEDGLSNIAGVVTGNAIGGGETSRSHPTARGTRVSPRHRAPPRKAKRRGR